MREPVDPHTHNAHAAYDGWIQELCADAEEAAAERDRLKAKLAKLDRKKPYLVHCASGGRSGKSMQLFRDLGFTRVYHMNDGFRGWEKAKLPAEKGKPKSPAK